MSLALSTSSQLRIHDDAAAAAANRTDGTAEDDHGPLAPQRSTATLTTLLTFEGSGPSSNDEWYSQTDPTLSSQTAASSL